MRAKEEILRNPKRKIIKFRVARKWCKRYWNGIMKGRIVGPWFYTSPNDRLRYYEQLTKRAKSAAFGHAQTVRGESIFLFDIPVGHSLSLEFLIDQAYQGKLEGDWTVISYWRQYCYPRGLGRSAREDGTATFQTDPSTMMAKRIA